MKFYMPTKVYHEKDVVMAHADEIAALGKKALIVTGRASSKKNGSLEDVKSALESKNTEYIVYDKIGENPTIDMVMSAADMGRSAGADFVIGIGGGSPMDAAKAIALMVQNRDTSSEVLYQAVKLKALPVVEVPTTCGTGSEVTPYAVLTRNELETKQSISHKIFPKLALIDSEYLENAPLSVLRNTAVDALGHFIESYFNNNADDYSRMICQYGLSVWAENIPVLLGEEADEDTYDSMLLASTLAGMAIAHTSTTIPHGLSYYMTYHKNEPHGKAVGMFLPGYLNVISSEFEGEVKSILEILGFESIEQFTFFIKQVIGDFDISDSDAERMVSDIMKNPRKLNAVPVKITEDELSDMVNYIR